MKPNAAGRLLEYIIYRELSSTRLDRFEREMEKISPLLQTNMHKCANIVKHYHKFGEYLTNGKISFVADSAGIKGNPSDLTIFNQLGRLNLSIKNNKQYTKSQRPCAFPAQLGLDEYDTELYNMCYDQIVKTPYQSFGKSACKKIPYLKELYNAVYYIVEFYLYLATKPQIARFFKFLIGSEYPHFQVLNKPNYVTIYDFTQIPIPTSFKIYRYNPHNTKNGVGYIWLLFNTGHLFSMRLHTAALDITYKLSLKFDTVLVNQSKIIPFETIHKI